MYSYREMLLCGRFNGFLRVTAVFFSIIMINVPEDVFVRDKDQFIVLCQSLMCLLMVNYLINLTK